MQAFHFCGTNSIKCCFYGTNGGEGGIRTPGTLACSTDFESAPFGRSGTSPWRDIIQVASAPPALLCTPSLADSSPRRSVPCLTLSRRASRSARPGGTVQFTRSISADRHRLLLPLMVSKIHGPTGRIPPATQAVRRFRHAILPAALRWPYGRRAGRGTAPPNRLWRHIHGRGTVARSARWLSIPHREACR